MNSRATIKDFTLFLRASHVSSSFFFYSFMHFPRFIHFAVIFPRIEREYRYVHVSSNYTVEVINRKLRAYIFVLKFSQCYIQNLVVLRIRDEKKTFVRSDFRNKICKMKPDNSMVKTELV